MSFYMTLPSDGSITDFPNNALSTFRTRFSQMMDLSRGEWEVGLTEMTFPTTVENVLPGCNYFEVMVPIYYTPEQKVTTIPVASPYKRYKITRATRLEENASDQHIAWPTLDGSGAQFSGKVVRFKFEVKEGCYRSIEALVEEINHIFETALDPVTKGTRSFDDNDGYNKIRLTYSKTFHRVGLEFMGPTIQKHIYPVRFCRRLAYQLGFFARSIFPDHDHYGTHTYVKSTIHPGDTTWWYSKTTYAELGPEVFLGMSGLYVYSDVVEPHIVGGKNLQLLRIAPFRQQRRETTHIQWEPQRVDYHPVARKFFDTLDLLIRDDTGEPVPFFNGKVIVKLHFRRKSPF